MLGWREAEDTPEEEDGVDAAGEAQERRRAPGAIRPRLGGVPGTQVAIRGSDSEIFCMYFCSYLSMAFDTGQAGYSLHDARLISQTHESPLTSLIK